MGGAECLHESGQLVDGYVVWAARHAGAATGSRAVLSGLNLVGLKRRDFDRAEINALRALYKSLFVESDGALMGRLAKAAKEYGGSECVQQVVEFMRVEQNRGYCTPRNK